jgi:hypothetical protein
MIRINELRLNNLITYSGTDTVRVMNISNTHLGVENNKIQKYKKIKKFNPIPLTDEWLVKLGFKRIVNDWYYRGVFVHTRKRGYVVRRSIPQVEYVHQLQNIFFVLKGKELDVV